MVINILGQLPVTINVMPLKSEKKSKKGLSPLDQFTKESIEANARLCQQYKVFKIGGLTHEIFKDRYINEVVVHCEHSLACVPRMNKTEDGMEYSALVVSKKNGSTMLRSAKYYEKHLRQVVPHIWPLDVEEENDDGFTPVTSNRGNQGNTVKKATPAQPTNIKSSIAAINQAIINTNYAEGVWYCVTFGRGGRRPSGVYPNWQGQFGAMYMTQGVSGAIFQSFPTEAEAWERFNLSYPNIHSEEDLRKFRMSIPHTETNKSPTWSDFDRQRFHRADSVAYTLCELDDQEMLEARIASTLRITGTVDGEINDRDYYIEDEWMTLYDNSNDKATDEVKGDDDNDNKMEEECTGNDDDEEEVPNSQEFNHETEMEADDDVKTTPKRRRVPAEGDEEAEAAAAAIPTSASKGAPTEFFAVAFPLPLLANTLSDALAFLHLFKRGFGEQYENQTMLCQCHLFPECMSAIVHCPSQQEAIELRHFILHNPMLGKYQLEAAMITNKVDVDGICNFDVQRVPHWEERASKEIIQYTKAATPIDVDSELLKIVYTSPVDVVVKTFYEKWWSTENLEESKPAHNAIKVPNVNVVMEIGKNDAHFVHARTQFMGVHFSESDVDAESTNSSF